MKLYTVVVHNLQMCMKEYCCGLKFRGGAPFKFWTVTIFLHVHLQVVYYKCAKFNKNPISGLGGVVLTRYMDGWMDGLDRVIPIYPRNFECGGFRKGGGGACTL
jgi:hypothetical protein